MATIILERSNLTQAENIELDAQMAKLATAAEVGDTQSFLDAYE
jgi:hypothetical protein